MGYTVIYNPLPEGVPEGKPMGTPESEGLYRTVYIEIQGTTPNFCPKILASWYPKWANYKGFLEPKSVNGTKS